MTLAWAAFGVCGVLILVAGTRLSREADEVAEATGLSRSFVGLLLLATVTSIPEMMTGFSAAAFVGEPNLAVGNVFGACVVNLFVIAVVDILLRGESVYTRAGQGHILSAGFGVMMLGIAGFGVLLDRSVWAIGHVGLGAPVLLLLYGGAVAAIYSYEHRRTGTEAETADDVVGPPVDLRAAGRRFIVAAAVVIGAALALPFVGDRIAEVMGWQQTFVGTLFLAIITTLPEMAVTFGALRLGQVDLAVGGLLGSNLFNVATVCLSDLVYVPGPILAAASPIHGLSAMSAMIMTGAVISALLYRPQMRLFGNIGLATPLLLAMYIVHVAVLYAYAR